MSQENPIPHEVDTYCAEWILNGGNQSQAWKKTFPNSKANEESVCVKASKFHSNVKVSSRLAEMQAQQAEKDEMEFDLSVSELKRTLREVMDAGLDDSKNLSAVVSAVGEVNRMNGNHAASKIANADGSKFEDGMPERELARRIALALTRNANKTNSIDDQAT